MKNWIHSFLDLILPSCCIVCGCSLSQSEKYICTACNIEIPRTNYHLLPDNPVEKFFWGSIPIERASSFFFYYRGSKFKHILYDLKYKGEKGIGVVMGEIVAAELLHSGFFQNIDLIIPVPLHKNKEKKRKYNQSERFAAGLSMVTGIPVDPALILRIEDTDTQTRKSVFSRWENVEGIFTVNQSEKVSARHILLVDDVLTTGSTITACAKALHYIENLKVSVLTLAISKQ